MKRLARNPEDACTVITLVMEYLREAEKANGKLYDKREKGLCA